MQWSFSNKGSALPNLLSFQGGQEDKQPKTGFNSLASSGLVTLTTDVFESSHRQFPASQVGYGPPFVAFHELDDTYLTVLFL